MEVCDKIRDRRKATGLTMKQLARMVGISPLTLHRFETGKVSPSVAILSEIAYHLGQQINDFFGKEERKFTIVKAGATPVIDSGNLTLKLMVPKGMIDKRISVSVGMSKTGKFVGKHKHNGCELTYIIKGKSIMKYGSKEYEVNKGDLIYFDANTRHSVVAIEPVEFLSIYFQREE